jgi:hypothetical protein
MRHGYLASIVFSFLALSACGGGSSSTTAATPVALSLVADDASVSWNKSSSIAVLQNDGVSRGSLTLSAVGAAAHGSAKLVGNSIEYTPNAGYFGPDTLSYTAQGEGGVQASSSVNIKVSADLKISGVVSDGPIANAQLSVTLGGQTFNTVAAADGSYSLTLKMDQPEDMISIVATGVGAQSKVKLQSLVSDAATLAKLANGQGEVNAAAASSLNVSHLSSALAALVIQDKLNQMPKTQAELEASVSNASIDDQMNMAAAIKLIVDKGVALPVGVADTLALVNNPTILAKLIKEQEALFYASYDEILKIKGADIAPVFAPAKTQSLVYFHGNDAEGSGIVIDYQPNGDASVHTVDGTRAATWSLLTGKLRVKLITPYVVLETDPNTGETSISELDGFYVSSIAGRLDSGNVLISRTGKSTVQGGTNAGKVSLYDGMENMELNKVMDMANFIPFTSSDFSIGTRWAGIADTASIAVRNGRTNADIFEVTGNTSGRMQRGELALAWSLTDGKLNLSTVAAKTSFTRLSKNARNGTEVWLMSDGNKVQEMVAVKVDQAKRFSSDPSLYRSWQSGFSNSLIMAIYADGTGVDFNQRQIKWNINDAGLVTFFHTHKTGSEYTRDWTLVNVNANLYTVLERLENKWRINVYKDLGPAIK